MMYDLIDRPLDLLPPFERGLLDRTRRWVHAMTLAGTAPAMGGEDGFADAMHALDQGSRDLLVIQRPCFATVEENEAVLLGIWRLVDAGRREAAQAAAEVLVEPDHARRMIAAMARVAATTRDG